MTHAAILVAAMVLDAIFGEPDWLWKRFAHPAVLMGRAVGWADEALNHGRNRRAKGVLTTAALGGMAIAIGAAIEALPGGAVLETLAAAVLLAQRSLTDHVRAVAQGLRQSLPAGRHAVAMIVSRDTADMDEAAVSRSAIESAAENLSDGVVAPVFWFLLAGLPGLLLYKIVNTADSMIGYRTPRHEAFGWAAARLDDALNLIPARLTALLIAAVHLRFDIWPEVRRDARLHKSPNAGWPEAAMAASLGIALAGPRSYGGEMRDFPFVNPDGRRDLTAADIESAAAALWRTWALLLCLVAILAIA
ncbi:MAG: adenosylcobinamide-phosphate synthase CbiB [Albidovulum sp.]|uniref:adenosylcobinamide-phosphate synthase CbiB n=1 Tax=Albidovulum sp. TaxID=1872424 RepID=UPI003C8D4091